MRFPAWDGFWDRAMRDAPWEITLREAALPLCRQRRTFVDGGAHAGVWSVALAPAFERVVAFEPCREALDCLSANTAALANVVVVPVALSDIESELRFALPHARANSGQMMVSAEGQAAPAIPLDKLGLHDLDLLKLDIEGWELKALVGARATLERCRPVVVMEENGAEALHGLPQRGARGFLLGLGYRVVHSFPGNIILVPEGC
jgi:FkbM family methyltransferase